MKGDEIPCSYCKTANVYNRGSCKVCGQWLGAPNVNASRTPEQLSALEKRYRTGLTNNTSLQLSYFEETVKSQGSAIKNVDLNMLRVWVNGPHPCYPYQEGVRRGIIERKRPENDRKRAMVDGLIFGYDGYNINFAALAVDETGLISYGNFSVKLSHLRVVDMASLLEENSFDFFDKIDLGPKKPVAPKGYISDWQDKHKLAVAKHYTNVTDTTLNEEFARILLHSDRDKHKDRFVEVHIWGELTTESIDSVRQIEPLITSSIDRRKREQELTLKKVQVQLGEKWKQ